MLDKEVNIKELYELKHRKDNEVHTHFDYEENFLRRSFPKYIYSNDTMYSFLVFFKKMSVLMIESILPIRNIFNFTVSKYYNRHSN